MNRLSGAPQNHSRRTEQPATSVHARLREFTHGQHVAAGRIPAMRRLFADDLTMTQYADHLARLLGFHEPLEAETALHRKTGAFRHLLGRAAALRDDLQTMSWSGGEIRAIPRCAQVPRFSAAGAWGGLYVILGSMLGGRVIADRLTSVLGPAVPLAFYAVGAREGNSRWLAFCRDLDRTRAGDFAEISDGARSTFASYTAWMDQEPLAEVAIAP